MKAILYIGHGTRSHTGAAEARAFVEKVKKRIDVPIQELSFLELTDPLIEQGFLRCVEKGASEITVVPLFLLAAGHIKQDIPNVLSYLQSRHPDIHLKLRNPFGVQEKMLDALADVSLRAFGTLDYSDHLLIVGRGSSDPGIHHDFARIVDGMKARTGLKHVSVCYLAAAQPSFDDALLALTKKLDSRMIVMPYLLFSGLLFDEVKRKVSKLQQLGREMVYTHPLSVHSAVEDVVIERAIK